MLTLNACDVPRNNQISAELCGSQRCEAQGLVATGHVPILALCRELIAAGLDPDRPLTVYRRGVIALHVRSIAEGARLTVEDGENGRPRFRLARPQRRGAALSIHSRPDFDLLQGERP
jgi:hypothetical protein